jgi:hypothetical protein
MINDGNNNDEDNHDDYNWIVKSMCERRNDFVVWNVYKILIRTWNVKTSFCDNDDDLKKWIFHNSDSNNSNDNIDIIVIGLQEIINLNNPLSSTLDLLSLTQSNYWKEKFLKVINKNNNSFNVVNTINCVGMCMFLFVKQDICHRISGIIIHIHYKKSHHYIIIDIRSSITPTGFLGLFGNKGAVSISIILDDTPICFVNCHLTSGRYTYDFTYTNSNININTNTNTHIKY